MAQTKIAGAAAPASRDKSIGTSATFKPKSITPPVKSVMLTFAHGEVAVRNFRMSSSVDSVTKPARIRNR